MKNLLVALFAVMLLASCQDKIAKPSPFIDESKMEDILYDVTLLYGAQNTNSFIIDTVQPVQMTDIFKKYEIDSLAFVENSRYYIALKKNVYYNMQTRVLERLKKEQSRLDTIIGKQDLLKTEKIVERTDSPADSLAKKEVTQP